jgi:Lrp/AsnC family transcriptional regulator, leucine-responsive regulatory protein
VILQIPNLLRNDVWGGLKMELDKKDFALLNELQMNASQRLEDLAKVVSLAPSSVHDRLRRLQREQVIRGWTVKVDAAAVGLGVLAFISVAASTSCSLIVPEIESIPWVEECHSVAGEWCIILKVRVPETATLLALVDRLKQIPGIEKTETTIVLKTQVERPVIVQPPTGKRSEVRTPALSL